MEDEGAPFLGEKGRTRLNWKARRGRGVGAGSLYATVPKSAAEKLGWKAPIDLEYRMTENGLVLAPYARNEEPTRRLRLPPVDRFLNGDVLDQLRRIPDQSVHLAMTSPPYNVGIEYSQYGDDRVYSAYRAWLRQAWREVYRTLANGGRFVLQTAPTSISAFRPIHIDLTNDAREEGFKFRAEILWYKQNMTARRTAWGSFRSPGHPHVIPSWEYANVLEKSSADGLSKWHYLNVLHKKSWKMPGELKDSDITNKEFVQWSDAFWEIPPDNERLGGHPATFPRELVERVLRFFSFRGQTILDPFGGTGTVAAVAKATGRHFIYIDHSREYCAVARKRVAGVRFGEDGRRPNDGPEGGVLAPGSSTAVRIRGSAPTGAPTRRGRQKRPRPE